MIVGDGYINVFDEPIIDGTWWPLKTGLGETSIVDDVCDMFDGPKFPYGLGDGEYAL